MPGTATVYHEIVCPCMPLILTIASINPLRGWGGWKSKSKMVLVLRINGELYFVARYCLMHT